MAELDEKMKAGYAEWSYNQLYEEESQCFKDAYTKMLDSQPGTLEHASAKAEYEASGKRLDNLYNYSEDEIIAIMNQKSPQAQEQYVSQAKYEAYVEENYGQWMYDHLYNEQKDIYQDAYTRMMDGQPGTLEYASAKAEYEAAEKALDNLYTASEAEIVEIIGDTQPEIPEQYKQLLEQEPEFFEELEAVLFKERIDEIPEYAKEMLEREFEQARIDAWEDVEEATSIVQQAYDKTKAIDRTQEGGQEAYDAAWEEYLEAEQAYAELYGKAQAMDFNNAEDKYIEENMEAAQMQLLAEYAARVEELCVRGAMMRCKCGSHYRRLNLPVCHGVMENERPKVNMEDMKVGPKGNVPYFGVCKSDKNPGTEETILLVNDCPRDAFGKKVGESDGKNVRGTKCTPRPIGVWQNPHEECVVDGAMAITPCSYLICQYGGIIEIVDSGQNDEETAI